MSYEEFLEYINNNLADCYKEIMISEDIEKADIDTISDNKTSETECLKIRKEIAERYEGCEVFLRKVVKNNGIVLDAISIYQKGDNVSPNIYLRPFYENYLLGKPLDFIMSEIVFQYRNEKNGPEISMVELSDYNSVKDKIIVRLVNYELNKDMLKDCPYKKYLDLAIMFRYVVDDSSLGIATIVISNKEYEKWGVDFDEVYNTALFNTMQRYPWCMEPLSKLVFNSIDKHMLDKLSDDIVKELSNIKNCELGVNIYILTNSDKVFGAGCILYDNVIRNFAKVQCANVYIMPSSVHEVMLVPEDEETDGKFLKSLLSEANRSSVGLIDLLSNNLYYYDKDEDRITIYNI